MAGHDKCRDGILDALLGLLSTRGAKSLTIRNVAAEAGVSIGAVQHHFPTKDALIVAAMTAVNERFRTRTQQRLAQETSAETRLRVFCHEIACISNTDLTEAIVWTAFAAQSSTDVTIRTIHSRDWARTEDVTLALLAVAYPDSNVTADDAALLLAVTDGIAVARASEQTNRMNALRAAALIDAVLQMIAGRGSDAPRGH